MKKIEAYQTEDGKVFSSKEEATNHMLEKELEIIANKNLDVFGSFWASRKLAVDIIIHNKEQIKSILDKYYEKR